MKALVIPIPHKRRTCLHVSGAVTTVYIALLMLRIHNEIFTGIGRLFDMYWDYLGFITNSVLFFLDFPDSSVLIVDITMKYCVGIILRIARVRVPLQWQNILTLGIARRNLCSLGVIPSSRICI